MHKFFGGRDPVRALRLPTKLTSKIDEWAARQPDAPSWSEAVRRLVEWGLATARPARRRAERAAKASEMAAHEIDRLADPSATNEERQLRKRRLIKGPKEFREMRNRANKG
jgi:hypothetical protein